MHIHPHLGVFWRSSSVIQIGLDPRVGVVIEGLTSSEQELVAILAIPHAPLEVRREAQRRRISPERTAAIVTMLHHAGVLNGAAEFDPDLGKSPPDLEPTPGPEPGPEPTPGPDPDPDPDPDNVSHSAGRSPHISSGTPGNLYRHTRNRVGYSVYLQSLDPLGVGIGVALAVSGVGRLVFDDDSPVVYGDHELLWPRWEGVPRSQAFLSVLRQVAPHVETQGEARCAVLSGSRLVNPTNAATLMYERIPHVLAWSEEIDICVGPLVEPGIGACSGCLFHDRIEHDPAWVYLAPQAFAHPPIPPVVDARDLAISLAQRAVLGYLDGWGNSLHNSLWRVPPLPGSPERVTVTPHPNCGCATDGLELPRLAI